MLHHKSWHVYSKDNQEKVRKDEKDAARLEGEKEARIVKADQEARLERLRQKKESSAEAEAVNDKEEHVNLFKDLEKCHGNADILVDQKAIEQKQWEDKYTMYLGETKDGKKDVPWYNESQSASRSQSSLKPSESDEQKRKRKARQEERRKKSEDPMEALRNFMDSRKSSGQPPTSHQSSVVKKSSSSSMTVDQLRRERLERELMERNRTHELLNPSSSAIAATHNSKKEFYNSQFNPSFIRERK